MTFRISMITCRDRMNEVDYEVLGLASDGRHCFWIFLLGLHGMVFL